MLFKNQSVLLKDFFNQQEDEPLKGISHKNILIKKNIIAYMALNGESTLADLARELHVSVPTITKLVGELVEENIVVDNGKIAVPISSGWPIRPSISPASTSGATMYAMW